jgi:hypothetical protein
MKYILDRNEMKPGTPAQVDAVDSFLAGLAPTLRNFTPYCLNLAKTKICSVVQEYEMAMIMAETRQATTVSGYGWEQGASYSSGTPLLSTSIQATQCRHRTALQLSVDTLHSLQAFHLLLLNLLLNHITDHLQNFFIHLLLIN